MAFRTRERYNDPVFLRGLRAEQVLSTEYGTLNRIFDKYRHWGFDDDTILDVGIGSGKAWADRKAGKITGLDVSVPLLDICRAKVTSDVHLLDLEDEQTPWPVPDNHFSVVVSEDVLAYVQNMPHVLNQMTKKATPKALIAFNYYAAVGKERTRTTYQQGGGGDVIVHIYHQDEIIDVCKSAGANLAEKKTGKPVPISRTPNSVTQVQTLVFVKG